MVQRPARQVLLVEDQTPIRTLLAEVLQGAGFDVTACATSKAALTAFPEIDPDLLIADIDLGSRPNGVELATILRTKAPYLSLLFITNYPSLRAFERTITPPARYAFLQKDLISSADRLLEVVRP
jgi:CheY-like chemotaxis protein